ncbi:MAG TPA: MarR family transcriptional regulator [Propionibacteriaceae bacterium]|nr:MarR family transcriptional regulator [Propionibacteriaceae bacterium]
MAKPDVADGPQDEVDRLVASWQQERPDLDISPMDVLSRVTRLARHLDLRRRQAFSAHGLESWEFDVLAALRRAGSPYQLSPGQLLRETMVTSGTMTNRVDRLAGRGLVSRTNHPGDRRGVLVTLTSEGKAAVDDAFSDLIAAEHTILASLPTADRRYLTSSLRELLTHYDEIREPT